MRPARRTAEQEEPAGHVQQFAAGQESDSVGKFRQIAEALARDRQTHVRAEGGLAVPDVAATKPSSTCMVVFAGTVGPEENRTTCPASTRRLTRIQRLHRPRRPRIADRESTGLDSGLPYASRTLRRRAGDMGKSGPSAVLHCPPAAASANVRAWSSVRKPTRGRAWWAIRRTLITARRCVRVHEFRSGSNCFTKTPELEFCRTPRRIHSRFDGIAQLVERNVRLFGYLRRGNPALNQGGESLKTFLRDY